MAGCPQPAAARWGENSPYSIMSQYFITASIVLWAADQSLFNSLIL